MVAIVFVLALSTVRTADASNSESVRGRVVAKSERPPPSGVLSTWIEILVEDKEGASPTKVFIPYMSERQRLPGIGESCDFNYHIETIQGAVGLKITKIQDAKVVERFTCQGN
jgi:hypothetical protein